MLITEVINQNNTSINPSALQVAIWLINILFFLLVSFVGFWFKGLLSEIKNDIKEIKEEMQRGAINFNANNIKIAELEKKVEVIETDVRVIGRKQDKCQYCNTDKHGD